MDAVEARVKAARLNLTPDERAEWVTTDIENAWPATWDWDALRAEIADHIKEAVEVAERRTARAEREECCKLVCEFCRDGFGVTYSRGRWVHPRGATSADGVYSLADFAKPCAANAIRHRNFVSE